MSPMTALEVRELVASGRREEASAALRAAVGALAGQEVLDVVITSDEYSLNSVSGIASLADGQRRFFKFHAEDGEQEHVGEYYRAQVLADAGLPIDVPLAVSTRAGEQLVLYRVRTDPRMVDVCRELEREGADAAELPSDVLAARRSLDAAIGGVAVASLRHRPVDEGQHAALHQLFSHRMHDPDGAFPGARLRRWYVDDPRWPDLAGRHWELNGVAYRETLDDIVLRARPDADPAALGRGPVVIAHGDDHHGNVWLERGPAGAALSLFDPAFAGDDIPALMALVKPTFHNVFAHPAWLYHPDEVDAARLSVSDDGARVRVGCAPLPRLRQQVLNSIVGEAWIPLLREMARRDALPAQWRRVVRSLLALCPLLVTDLLAPGRSPAVQMLGLAHVVMMGSEPVAGTDLLTIALDRMQEAVDGR